MLVCSHIFKVSICLLYSYYFLNENFGLVAFRNTRKLFHTAYSAKFKLKLISTCFLTFQYLRVKAWSGLGLLRRLLCQVPECQRVLIG